MLKAKNKLHQILGRHYKWLYIILFYQKREMKYKINNIVWSLTMIGYVGSITFVYYFANKSIFSEVVEYMFYTHILFLMANPWINLDLSNRIFEGKLTADLLSPTHVFWKYIFAFVGRNNLAYNIISIPSIIIFWLFIRQYLTTTITFENFILTIPMVIIGYFIYYCIGFMIGSVAFWVNRTDAVNEFLYMIRGILRGDIVMLSITSLYWQGILIQPFAFVGYHAFKILTSKYSQIETIGTFIVAIFWCIVLFILSRIIFKFGLKHYEAVGL